MNHHSALALCIDNYQPFTQSLTSYATYGIMGTEKLGGTYARYGAGTNRVLDAAASCQRIGDGNLHCAGMAQRGKTARLPIWQSMEDQEIRTGGVESQQEKYQAWGVVPQESTDPPIILWRDRGGP